MTTPDQTAHLQEDLRLFTNGHSKIALCLRTSFAVLAEHGNMLRDPYMAACREAVYKDKIADEEIILQVSESDIVRSTSMLLKAGLIQTELRGRRTYALSMTPEKANAGLPDPLVFEGHAARYRARCKQAKQAPADPLAQIVVLLEQINQPEVLEHLAKAVFQRRREVAK